MTLLRTTSMPAVAVACELAPPPLNVTVGVAVKPVPALTIVKPVTLALIVPVALAGTV